MTREQLKVGIRVRAFDPFTLGVVRYGEVLVVGAKYARIDFGLTGVRKVRLVDVLEAV